MKLSDKPLFTDEYNMPGSFTPEAGSTYIFGVTSEQRSEFALDLKTRASNVRFIEIRESDRFVVETNLEDFGRIPLRRRSIVDRFVHSLGDGPLYLDMTGLGHSAWAPLTKVCLEAGTIFRVVYVEPQSYARNTSPRAGEIFDLSDSIDGIEPIPLFATLEDAPETRVCFVPLLGFEGPRFAHMWEAVQPLPRKTIPILGVPGFQPEYPFSAYLGNANVIERADAQRDICFAKSNCPFSVFYALEEIAERHVGQLLKVGLVGTKPHALGAILYALCGGSPVEILYDHVKRKSGRTRGIDRCLVYGISDFLSAAASHV